MEGEGESEYTSNYWDINCTVCPLILNTLQFTFVGTESYGENLFVVLFSWYIHCSYLLFTCIYTHAHRYNSVAATQLGLQLLLGKYFLSTLHMQCVTSRR